MGYIPFNDNRPVYPRFAKRTVQILHLPADATYADIVNVVRGGMLLEIYLRSRERTAAVSFLEECAAQAFFQYAKKQDLYIRDKRVSTPHVIGSSRPTLSQVHVQWHTRQFVLANHIAHRIYGGATRNLVIRNASMHHTEKEIRNHLEHIHNLAVIKVTHEKHDIRISTNSVHNAISARTCMMQVPILEYILDMTDACIRSRAIYKGFKIDWDDDECAGLPPNARPNLSKQKINSTKRDVMPKNRFDLLNVDDVDEESEDEEISDVSCATSDSISQTGVAV